MRTVFQPIMVFFILLLSNNIQAQEEIKLWGNEEKPFYKPNDLKEYEKQVWGTRCVFNITEPTLTIYKAEGKNSQKAVVIIPGGGYELVAVYHEGHDLAKILANQGITAAVLKYRLPLPASSNKPHMVPLSDARKALKILHEKASLLNIDTDKIGVIGFSAGSHLATVMGLWKSEDTDENPDFSGLIYGVTRMTKENITWLENSLYYRKLTQTEIAQNSLLNLVSAHTPPAFLVHSYDDDVCSVEETTAYATKLKENSVLVEMHLFDKGGHGFGIGRAIDGTDQWITLFVNWLKRNSFN